MTPHMGITSHDADYLKHIPKTQVFLRYIVPPSTTQGHNDTRSAYTYKTECIVVMVSTKMEAISTFQGHLLRLMSKDLTQAQCTTVNGGRKKF